MLFLNLFICLFVHLYKYAALPLLNWCNIIKNNEYKKRETTWKVNGNMKKIIKYRIIIGRLYSEFE